MAAMPEIFKTLSTSDAMDLDLCMSTGDTAKACLMEPEYCKFTGFDSDCACEEKMMPSLVETFARQILSKNSDIDENADVENAARLYLQNCTSARSGL